MGTSHQDEIHDDNYRHLTHLGWVFRLLGSRDQTAERKQIFLHGHCSADLCSILRWNGLFQELCRYLRFLVLLPTSMFRSGRGYVCDHSSTYNIVTAVLTLHLNNMDDDDFYGDFKLLINIGK